VEISDGFYSLFPLDISPRLIRPYRPTVKEGMADPFALGLRGHGDAMKKGWNFGVLKRSKKKQRGPWQTWPETPFVPIPAIPQWGLRFATTPDP